MADADVIVVGAGLAGLVAACELVERGRRVLIVDQENAANIGGQAFWSFGGLFFVDSPEQRRLGIRDSHELALQDWLGTAGFDRPEDHWPRQWAHAYVDFAAGEKRSWLRERGLQTFPLVGWAERGGYDARGHGNSVPRFHITWGTGPAIVDIFARRLLGNAKVRFAHRHRVDELIVGGRRGGRGARGGAGADDCGARCGVVTKHRGRVRVPRAGGDRRQRWHRRRTTTWSGRTGPSGWAGCPNSCSAACPPTSTAG